MTIRDDIHIYRMLSHRSVCEMGMSLDTARIPRDTLLDPSQEESIARRHPSGQRFSTAREFVQMDVYIRSKPIHGDEPQIAAEISRILNIDPGRSEKVSVGENPRTEMKGGRTNRESGRPYPKPAIGAWKSLA